MNRCLRILTVLLILGLAGAAAADETNLSLSFTNLASLDPAVDGLYEGWAIVGGAPVSTGVFNVNAAGEPVDPVTGDPVPVFDAGTDISGATSIKISLEPPMDADPAPSGLIVLSGDPVGDTALLTAAVPGLDMLASATGAYILATPSDDAVDTMNGDQGIWFLTMPGPMAGLVGLPDLGSAWTYEGWVVDVSGAAPVPYSTGTFSAGDMADGDLAGCNGGGPPFPGQDFTAFHCGPVLDLDSGDFAAVISIEPVPDNNPGPFAFKPLAGMIPVDALMNGGALLNQTDATFPQGVATLGATVATEELGMGELKSLYR